MEIGLRSNKRFRDLKAVASTDRRDFQVECGMLRMPAIVKQRFRRHVFLTNLHILVLAGMVLAEVSAQSALSFLNWSHMHLD